MHSIINEQLEHPYQYTLNALKELSQVRKLKKDMYLLTKNKDTILRIQDENINAYGIGIDIGTTTLVITLMDLLHKRK